MRKLSTLLLTTAVLASVALHPVLADEWREHGEGHEHGEWIGDIGHFHEHDYDHWREGRWFHGFHEDRDGWWWIVGGLWYFYPAPIYPYPDPYTPPTVVVETAPVAPVGVAPTYAYYCANPAGYYPYVARCYNEWRRVENVATQPAPVAAPVLSQHEKDERELRDMISEFEGIDPHGRHAAEALKSVEKQVESFRQNLYNRDYNAMTLLRDAERLQHRIQEKREEIAGH